MIKHFWNPKEVITDLGKFIIESNKIEGENTLESELLIYEWFLANDLDEENLKGFHKRLCDARHQVKREYRGVYRDCSIWIGGKEKSSHRVEADMYELFEDKRHYVTPFHFHRRYEHIHPFVDLNGRTGRAVWLYQMLKGQDVPLGFLHTWYYQSLSP